MSAPAQAIARTCPCRYCTKLTHMTGTQLCDRCWELESRIRRDPDLAEKVLRAVREGEES